MLEIAYPEFPQGEPKAFTDTECIDGIARYVMRLEERILHLENWRDYMMKNGLCTPPADE